MSRISYVSILAVVGMLAACGGSQPSAASPTGTTASTGSTEAATGTPAAGGPQGGSIAEQTCWTHLNERLTDYAKVANDACGTTFKTSYDTGSFRGHLSEDEGGSCLSTYVLSSIENVFIGLQTVCNESPNAKKAVVSKVKEVEIKLGDKGKQSVSVSSSKLSAAVDPDVGGATMHDGVVKYLRSSL